MNIRLMGTADECAGFVEALRGIPGLVREVSTPRPNRGDSILVRVYVDVDWPADQPLIGGPIGHHRQQAMREIQERPR